ncbi:hypothetical protein TNCV_968181 [Trichonephila clavipes]|nr:hypothetical protein TNCV_968181 [Trichonephila clavipes]
MHDIIQSDIDACYSCMMSFDISSHNCCERASSSTKLIDCPTCRPKYSQICSISGKSEDRVDHGKEEMRRRQSCEFPVVYWRALSS